MRNSNDGKLSLVVTVLLSFLPGFKTNGDFILIPRIPCSFEYRLSFVENFDTIPLPYFALGVTSSD